MSDLQQSDKPREQDTPRTDEQVNILIPRVTNIGCVPADFARQLERELAFWMPKERPEYGAPGSRDVDIGKAQRKWDEFQALASSATGLKSLPEANELAAMAMDARRYRWLRNGVFAHRVEHGGRIDYMLAVNIPQREQTNIMKGSIAGHMDDEIDKAIVATDETASKA